MSREAFGDPPESQEPPDLCPVCGGDQHADDCEFGQEVARRLKAERNEDDVQSALTALTNGAQADANVLEGRDRKTGAVRVSRGQTWRRRRRATTRA